MVLGADNSNSNKTYAIDYISKGNMYLIKIKIRI